MLLSSFVSSREILNSAKGVTYPWEEYSWISLDMIIAGRSAPAEHDAHHGVLDPLVHVGDLVHGEVLHGQRHRRAHDDVVLLLPGGRAEGEIEQQLVGALGVVDELGMLGARVAQLGDEARHLPVHLRGASKEYT